MKKLIKKIESIDKEVFNYNLAYLAFSLFSLTYVAQKGATHGMKGVLLLGLFATIFLVGFYFVMKKIFEKKVKLEKIFLIFAATVGIFYVLGFPPSCLPDDRSDYLRSLEVSDFHATSVQQKNGSVGREYPANIETVYTSKSYGDVMKNLDLKLEGETKFLYFANKSLYAFVCYLPQAVGVGLGKLLHLPIVIGAILGKLCNLMFYLLVVYLSIKYIPSKKYLIFFIGMLPIALQEAASLSPDCLAIALSIGLVAFITWARETKKVFGYKEYLLISTMSITLALCKIVYLPMCFMLFLLPKESFKGLHKKWKYLITLSIFLVLLNLVWLKISSPYLESFSARSNSSEQLAYILQNPIRYLIIITTTIDVQLFNWLDQMVGHALGAFQVNTPYVVVAISLGILTYLLIKKDKKQKDLYDIVEKSYILLIIAAVLGLTFTSLYMQWTAVGAQTIDGIQGRYFIPLLLPLAMLFMTKKDDNEEFKFILPYMYIGNFLALCAVLVTYM